MMSEQTNDWAKNERANKQPNKQTSQQEIHIGVCIYKI